jgi:hypothetical protein
MVPLVTEVLLWLFVINHGVALGAGLYETRMIVSPWIVALQRGDDARLLDSGQKFWAFVTTLPLTLLTLASLVAAWHTPDAIGSWWLGAALVTFVERIMTFAYFIPGMLKLQRGQVSPQSKVKAAATRWAKLNYVRSALSLAAWVAALKAFSLLNGNGG